MCHWHLSPASSSSLGSIWIRKADVAQREWVAATPTTGCVLIDGVDLSQLNRTRTRAAQTRRTKVGVAFQNYNLIPTFRVGENVGLPLELVEIALEEVGLGGMADRFPDEISGRQAQRVAIARVLLASRSGIIQVIRGGSADRIMR